jgi:hypothetical protein
MSVSVRECASVRLTYLWWAAWDSPDSFTQGDQPPIQHQQHHTTRSSVPLRTLAQPSYGSYSRPKTALTAPHPLFCKALL